MAEEAGHSEPTDHELLRRAAEGERQAFELLYQRYQQVVYRFARAMTGRSDVAEDVTQEVFIALIKELPRYDPARAGFTTYLYGIARNLSRDQWRRTQRRLVFEAIGLESHETTDDPFDLMERAQVTTQVRRALRGLPLRYREVIILCDLHGLAYAEAAVVVGSSVSGVRARLHRARHLLRKRLSRPARASPRPARQSGNQVRDMTAWSTRMTSAADDSRNDVADDVGVLGEAWRQFAREDAAMAAPPELERKVLAAWETLQHPDRRSHPPSRRRLAWVVGAVASALAVAFALHGHRAAPVPVATDSRVEQSAIRNSGDAPPRLMMKRDAILTFTAEPALETETLQLVRVRMPRLALQAVGVVVSGPNADGFVEMDLVVGEDGLPKTVRRVALVQ